MLDAKQGSSCHAGYQQRPGGEARPHSFPMSTKDVLPLIDVMAGAPKLCATFKTKVKALRAQENSK